MLDEKINTCCYGNKVKNNENHNVMPSKHVCLKHYLESFLLLHVFLGNMPNVISLYIEALFSILKLQLVINIFLSIMNQV